MKNYDLIISLGEACSCSSCLRALNLQKFSYPFDWLFGATFLKRIELLTLGFKNFLNKEDLIFSYTEKSVLCDAYYNKFTGLTYNHDFPAGVPLDESFSALKDKYDRRINRLLKQILEADSFLVVYIELPNTENKLDSNSVLIAAQAELQKAFPTTRCDILYLHHNASLNADESIIEQISENIMKVSLFNKDPDPNMPPYAINRKMLNEILTEYQLNHSQEP